MFPSIPLLLGLSPPAPTGLPTTLPSSSSAPTSTSTTSSNISSAPTTVSNTQQGSAPSSIQTIPSTSKQTASAQSKFKSLGRTQKRFPNRQLRYRNASKSVASTSTSSNAWKNTSSTCQKTTRSTAPSRLSGSASTSSSNASSKPSSSAKKNNFKEHPVEYLDDNFGANLYGCAFNQFLAPTETPVVALVGSKGTIAVYSLPQNSNKSYKSLYNGKLGTKEEKDLNTVTWCFDVSNKTQGHKIVCGEETGRMYVLNTSDMTCENVLIGSQAAISDLRTHPTNGAMVATAGNDCTVRIYHIRHESALVVCAGIHGHHQCVQTVTWSSDGHRLISGGNDQRIMMWDVEQQKVRAHLEEKSRILNQGKKLALANLKDGQHPRSHPKQPSSNFYHHRRSLLSDNNIQVWVMGSSGPENRRDGQMSRSRRIAATIPVASRDPWADLWIRFAVDPLGEYVVASNTDSQLMFYDFKTGSRDPIHTIMLRDPAYPSNLRMRQAKFSPDGKIVLVVGDFAFMKRFDRI
ncbi:Protein CBG02012 [Caenorhabditis briggsae]|uniref:Protein CBG02012 n=1 Tax=Caenorhabditis briggsae TaxID=6238 RepID=A8WRT1_CAEBR|nr:Protein CBG02012 [Caenorhabditis briggsae]CAP23189.2 Protein CBG02012 [Caenorhabditis briggsae]